MTKRSLLLVITLLLAAAEFARCYTTLTYSYVDLTDYANGLARMPFQGRMLMMYPLRWAEHSQFLIRFTAGREGALRSPALALLTVFAFVCICLTGVLLTALYLQISRRRIFVWLPFAFLLVIATVQYIVHVQNSIYPYDMTGLFLFNLGLYFIYTHRSWWLVLLFPLITLNREVSLFLIVLLALDRWAEEGWPGLRSTRLILQCLLMSATWVAIRAYVQHRFLPAITPDAPRQKNILELRSPQFWPQIAELGAFLIPILFIYRKRILDRRVRAYLWVTIPWLICMFLYGELIETRVFGELSGLIALAAVLELEETATIAGQPAT